MTRNRPKILLVDDDRQVLNMLDDLFVDVYETLKASSGGESLSLVKKHRNIAAVVMDIKMTGMDGISAAREIRGFDDEIPIIFHTGYPGEYDEDEISEQEKPFDYILKGESISRLTRAVHNAVETYLLNKDGGTMTEYAQTAYSLVGKSELMRKVYQLIRKIAPNDNKVMIFGETGTGKELVARAIHLNSPRREQRLAIFNCNHKAPDLVESELFGHVKGTFTGAVADRIGLFEYAHNGTVFLDEISDLDITTQAKLLRVLETGEYSKVGSPEISKTDVRILCATNKDLPQQVDQEKFREDLFYRLKGIIITLPPLRERREDIPLLIEKFKDSFTIEKGLSPKIFDQAAINFLINHDWPGNVRALEDTVESVITLSDSDIIFLDDVVSYLKTGYPYSVSENGNKGLAERTHNFRRNCIIEALSETKDNVAATARILKTDRANLRKKIIEYKINLSE